MNKLISIKHIPVYIVIVIAFYFLFNKINCHYILDKKASPHIIDVHVQKTVKLFDAEYVKEAKSKGYDHKTYFQSFFIVDFFFPIIYTLLFLSIIKAFEPHLFLQGAQIFVITGFMLDWAENFSFASYLLIDNDNLARVVAFFTTFKSLLFVFNLGVALIGLSCLTVIHINKWREKLVN